MINMENDENHNESHNEGNDDTHDVSLVLQDLGINAYREIIVFLREDSNLCKAEGFGTPTRVMVTLGSKSILATLNTISSAILKAGEASLSSYAWQILNAKNGDKIYLSHPPIVQSLSFVRAKVYNRNPLSKDQIKHIVEDIAKGSYSDIDLSMFITACSGNRLNQDEIYHLVKSMVDVGQTLKWQQEIIVDKHSIGGLPGNRTTLIAVPIVAYFGLTMPKTSSRAITSPSGSADTMEVLAPVNLNINAMRKVVALENACVVWGGAVDLSPADDVLIRVERVMDVDSGGQLVASVLSKKIAAGSNHILIDIPIGSTAKIRSLDFAYDLERIFVNAAKQFGIKIQLQLSDGSEPVGCGIGPSLEAQDVINVLQGNHSHLYNLYDRSLTVAGAIIEFSPKVKTGEGKKIAKEILDSGRAWQKFQAICDAQGGMREPKLAKYTHTIVSPIKGSVANIDNRVLSRIARLAGAPQDKEAGIYLHSHLNAVVDRGAPVYTVYANSKGQLKYALSLLEQGQVAVSVVEGT